MTETQKDSLIQSIQDDTSLPLPVKARKIEAVVDEFNSINNPSPVLTNGKGESITRREFADMTREERAEFFGY